MWALLNLQQVVHLITTNKRKILAVNTCEFFWSSTEISTVHISFQWHTELRGCSEFNKDDSAFELKLISEFLQIVDFSPPPECQVKMQPTGISASTAFSSENPLKDSLKWGMSVCAGFGF